MSGEQQQEPGAQQETHEQNGPRMTEKPEVTDEHKRQAEDMAKVYEEDRPTSTLPGSKGTVSGTAVTDWLDEKDKGHIETTGEEGNVEFRKTDEFRRQMEE